MELMQRVAFGRTGMEISRVGFGAWAAGGPWNYGWGPQDDDASIAAIHRAVELGVNWIDTAPVYGWGHSEEVVARALAGMSAADRPYVFTKCGPALTDTGGEQSRGGAEHLRYETEKSLQRLGIERIDLLQMHWPAEDDVPVEEYWSTMLALCAEGKVAHVGLSNHDVDQLEVAEAIGHVESLQPPFSAIDRAAAADVLPWCHAHETGVIVYSPMQAGLLTGAFSRERVDALAADDWRRRESDFTDNLDANLAVADALRPIATKHNATVPDVAIAWVLAWPGVSAAIVGARNAGQVEGWVGGAALVLDNEDFDAVAAAISASGAGQGPTRP